MDQNLSFSWMCQRFGLSEGILLLRNRQGLLQVAGQHGFSKLLRQREFLEWATELDSLLRETRAAAGDGAAAPWPNQRGALAGCRPAHERWFWPLKPAEARGVSWKSPVLAAIPVMAAQEAAGLLVLGGKPARLERAVSLLASMLGTQVEAQRLKERLKRLEHVAALGELVYHVAHEINNPLTTVVGYAELLADQTDDATREPMKWLKSEAERALGVARNVLSLARGQEEKQPSDVRAVLERALALREYALRVAGIEVHTELEPNLPALEINPSKLQQVFLNILINAEQALETARGPRILWLRASRGSTVPGGKDGNSIRSRPGEWVQVEICNNGPPIPPAWLERIFEPFFTSKPAGIGTGLGLAIARSTVESEEGEIAAANEDGGVVFRLRLRAAAGKIVALRSEELFVRNSSLRGRQLLVVEDEPPIAQLIRDVLQAEGCLVSICGTAEEALSLLERHRFDALLSDLKLPGKGGRWLFQQISRAQPRVARKTLFITGDTVSQSTVNFLRATGQPALAKPFHVRELKAAVENLLL